MKKSQQSVPFPAFPDLISAEPSAHSSPSAEPSAPDSNSPEQAKEKYWEKKMQELTLENIKLQEKVAEATKSRDRFVSQQLEPAKVAAKAAEEAFRAEAEKVKQLQEEVASLRRAGDQMGARLLEEQGELQRYRSEEH